MDTQKAVMLQVTNGKKVLHLAKVAPPVRIHMNAGRISSKSQKVKKKRSKFSLIVFYVIFQGI